jgi:hypothetical protein
MNTRYIFFILIVFVMSLTFVYGYNILVWDKDEGDQYEDHDTQQLIGSEINLVSALQDVGELPEVLTSLPDDITVYDIIFVCTGWYSC